MAARGNNFVAGEAPESDEEYEIDQSYFMKNTMVAKNDDAGTQRGIVVQGEASESDESEAEVTQNELSDSELGKKSSSLETGKSGLADEETKRKLKFHYDSGFHRRLSVCNLELRSEAIENRIKIYDDANKKLQSAVFYLNRSQALIQDAFSNVGLVSGDLQAITESLEKILSQDILPTLKIREEGPRITPLLEPSL